MSRVSPLTRLVAALVAAGMLAACHPPRIAASPAAGGAAGGGLASFLPGETSLIVRGKVEFPSRAIAATSTEVVSVATINMIDPSNNNTVGTATTNAAGSFTLVPNQGFSPASGVYYVLDAVKGLGTNQPGKPSVRLRTLITWDTTPNVGGWKSITNTVSTVQGGQISIRTLTTALALINAFDGARVSGSALIGKVGQVSGQWVLSSDALAPTYSDEAVAALDTQINSYLANDLDPIATVNALKPTITALDVPSVHEGQLFAVTGTGFSPVPSQNTLIFNTGQSLAGAQILNPLHASGNKLVFKLPTSFPIIGAGYVSLIMNNQQSNWASLTTTNPPASGGSGGGSGGSSNPSAPKLTAMSAAAGVPGDSITLSGTNFSTTMANNIVYFNGTAVVPHSGSASSLVVTLPDGAKSGALYVQTKDGESNRMYYVVYGPQTLAETFADASKFDQANSTTQGWPGSVTVPANANTEFGSGANGVWSTTGNTTWTPTMTTLSGSAPSGANSLGVGSSSGFAANDEILVLRNIDGSNPGNAGQHEFVRINSVSGNNLLLKTNLQRAYPSGALIQKVYHYTDVNIAHTINAGQAWNGSVGGIIAFRASKQVTIKSSGRLYANSVGYRGGQGGSNWIYTGCGWYYSGGYVGEGRRGYYGWVPNDTSVRTTRDFDFAGHPMVAAYWCCWGGGKSGSSGGGSHATQGYDGAEYHGVSNWNEGCGGWPGGGHGAKITGGTADDSTLTMGGGGAGAYYWNWEGTKTGGNGGGVIFIAAPKITVESGGQIAANGGDGQGGSYQASGAGAGGTVLLKAITLTVNGSLRAVGGNGGTWSANGGRPGGSTSGNGGQGRIKTLAIASIPATPSYDAVPAVGWQGTAFPTGTFPTTAFTGQSKAYDTGTTRPIFTGYSADQALAGGTATYQFSDSSDGGTFGAWTGDITTLTKRYIRWKVTLQGANTTVPPQVRSMTIKYRSVVN